MHTRIAQTNMSRTRITLALDPTAKKKQTTYTHVQLFYIAFNAHYAAGRRTHAPNDPVYNGPRRAWWRRQRRVFAHICFYFYHFIIIFFLLHSISFSF